MYNYGVPRPRKLRLDQARFLTCKKFEEFCSKNNFEQIYAPAHDHRAIGLVEHLIQTIKQQVIMCKSTFK